MQTTSNKWLYLWDDLISSSVQQRKGYNGDHGEISESVSPGTEDQLYVLWVFLAQNTRDSKASPFCFQCLLSLCSWIVPFESRLSKVHGELTPAQRVQTFSWAKNLEGQIIIIFFFFLSQLLLLVTSKLGWRDFRYSIFCFQSSQLIL